VNTKYKQGKAHKGMAAMAARAICKETVSFGLVNIVPIQVSIARQEEANHIGIREVSREGGS
jgi:non-homologous end joining protein Ku